VDVGLEVRVGRVCSEPLSDFQDDIDVFLLGVKNKNPDGDQQSVDSERDDSSRSSKPRPESGRKCESIFTTVEKDGQRPGQHDAEEWDHPYENAEHACLERGTNGNAPVHRPYGRAWTHRRRGKPRVCGNLRREGFGCSRIRSRNLYVDLRSAALRTKRSTVLDRGPTLLARVLHAFEASAQRTRRARQGIG